MSCNDRPHYETGKERDAGQVFDAGISYPSRDGMCVRGVSLRHDGDSIKSILDRTLVDENRFERTLKSYGIGTIRISFFDYEKAYVLGPSPVPYIRVRQGRDPFFYRLQEDDFHAIIQMIREALGAPPWREGEPFIPD